MTLLALFKRREIWIPTLWGWAAIAVILAVALGAFAAGIHPFLAAHRPVQGELLIVEGWLDKPTLEQAVALFRSGGYRQVVTTGAPIPEGTYFADLYPDFGTYAEVSAAALREKGIEADRVVPVPAPPVEKDRTYASAVAVRQWLEGRASPVASVDVLSEGPHARRTWYLFDLALGGRVRVGVIALESRTYDPDRWWRSSAGVRTVIGEMLAYLYARFLFYPDG